ncbi:MAG: 6,7-dimethyl-8-ribityllumazine synthase [Gemmatimonadota bacterium]
MRGGRAREERPLDAAGRQFAIVVSRFNESVTGALLDGARHALVERGADATRIDVYRVPGAWELPGAVARALGTARYDAIVAIGCVIRGETPHFDYVAGGAADGLAELARAADVPITFGLLTTDTAEQAAARAGGEHGNKGRDAALAALEMIDVYRAIDEASGAGP